MENSLDIGGAKCEPMKTMFSAKKSSMLIVLLHLQQFRGNSLLKCVPVQKCQKINKIAYLKGWQSFMVINANTSKKLTKSLLWQAASPCLSATLFTLDEPTVVK